MTHEEFLVKWSGSAIVNPLQMERDLRRVVAAEHHAIDAAAQADMLRGNPITGAHHRALKRRLAELEGASSEGVTKTG